MLGICREELKAGKTIQQALAALCSTWTCLPSGLARLAAVLGLPSCSSSPPCAADARLFQLLSSQPSQAYEVQAP